MGYSLRRGDSTSCGCRSATLNAAAHSTHGMRSAPEYWAWAAMKGRCLNQNNPARSYYLDRGITVCPEWLDSFEQFYADMGPRPSPRHSIDRIDNDRGYAPQNCRWALPREQNLNKRTNFRLTHDGLTLCVTEWEQRLGSARGTVRERLRLGWTVERALTTPPDSRRGRPRPV
jgi:hypothetical protein